MTNPALFAMFKIRFKTGIQYRAAAFAGMSTQFFWGFMLVMLYEAFYANAPDATGITFSQLVDYTWLQQGFLYLVALWIIDREIVSQIESGGIAYELVRPINLYMLWLFKMAGMRISGVMLRFVPIVTVCMLLPKPYNLSPPASPAALILFIISLALGLLVTSGFMLLLYMVGFYTVSISGMINLSLVLAQIFTGQFIPVALMPDPVQRVIYLTPFAYIGDFPFRIYSGNLVGADILTGFCVQAFWIVTLFAAGNLLLRGGLKKVVSQGG